MVVDCYHEACVSQSENSNLQKKIFFFENWVVFFPKLGNKFLRGAIKTTNTCMLQLDCIKFSLF